jgi:AcrR family transcriptional regulator
MPGDVRRAKLLELARTTFITNGYHATTTRAIAEEAGISETLVLKHFRSKEELFRAAVVQPFFELLDRAGNKLDDYARTGRVLSVEDRFRVVLGFFSTWAAIVREERQLIVARARPRAGSATSTATSRCCRASPSRRSPAGWPTTPGPSWRSSFAPGTSGCSPSRASESCSDRPILPNNGEARPADLAQ